MPDPLMVLPYELWTLCISFAIGGQQSGPLELLIVSMRWATVLLNSPSLWTHIYIQNGEDEMGRISAFLHLSKGCSLHVDIMTVLPTIASLQLIAENISRVATISIRPGASDNNTVFPMEQWKQAASNILLTLSNGRRPPEVEDNSCFGISLQKNGQWHYRVILMLFTTAVIVTSSDDENGIVSASLPDTVTCLRRWEEYITRCIRLSANQDSRFRIESANSIGKLASYAQYHDAIRIAIPSFIKLLRDTDVSVQLATVKGLHAFAVHVDLREALCVAIPSLLRLFDSRSSNVRWGAIYALRTLAVHGEFHEALRVSIPPLVRLLQRRSANARSAAVSVLENLTKHNEFHEALETAIPSLLRSLEIWDSNVRSAALTVLKTLAAHAQFHGALMVAIPSLVQLLKRRRIDNRAVAVLNNLANHSAFHEALMAADSSFVHHTYGQHR